MPTTRFAATPVTSATVQAAVTASAHGDTVIIPAGDWQFDTVVTNGGKNVIILGEGMGQPFQTPLTKISRSPSSNIQSLFHYTAANNAATAEIGMMELFGENFNKGKLWVDGVANFNYSGTYTPGVGYSGGVFSGGMRMHHIRFSSTMAGNTGVGQWHFVIQGWIIGVMDHCEIMEGMNRTNSAETSSCNHNGSPTGVDAQGDYAAMFPTDGSELAGTKDIMYFEDCIWHKVGAVIDSNAALGGGGMICHRHSISWGPLGGHGCRESGSDGHGTRLLEDYNNIEARGTDAGGLFSWFNNKQNYVGQEQRDGELVAYNNFITIVDRVLTHPFSNSRYFTAPAGLVTAVNMGHDRFHQGADGANPLDFNEKRSVFTDEQGRVHARDAGYTYTSPAADGDIVTAGVAVRKVSTGLADNSGDVYGHSDQSGLGVPIQNDIGEVASDHPIINLRITFTLPSGLLSVPANYFSGFILRDADVLRSQTHPGNMGFILSHPASTGNVISCGISGSAPMILSGIGQDVANTGRPGSNIHSMSLHMEIRKIRQYWCTPGYCQSIRAYNLNSNPLTFVSGLVDWSHPLDPVDGSKFKGTCKAWGNMMRIVPCTSIAVAELSPPLGS